MPTINFLNADVALNLKNKRLIRQTINQLFLTELHRTPLQLDIIFCSDEYLLNINQQFLQHDYFTDIITFDHTEDKSSGTIGELYISIDRVKDNALTEQVLFSNELFRVIFHGCLHLCGYGDKKKSEITKMREREDYYLKIFTEK